jgi:hypothetical protein
MKSALTIHIPDELKQKIEQEAKRNNISINQYVVYTLTKEISAKEAEGWLRSRIELAPPREEALHLLQAIIPNGDPFPEDRL